MADKSGGRELFIGIFLLNAVLAIPGLAYPAKESVNENTEVENAELLSLPFIKFHYEPLQPPSDKPKHCYHFYVSQNMSSLLSDATKMLRQVHDKREREWILTFIYRIKSLAEHLRSHPDARRYEQCISGENVEKKKNALLSNSLRVPQQELYFVDDTIPYQKRSISEVSDSTSVQAAEETEQKLEQPNFDSGQGVKQPDTSIQEQKVWENFNSVAESTSEAISMKKDVENDHHQSESTIAGTAVSELTSSQVSHQEPVSESPKEEDDWMIGKGGDDSAIIISSPEPDCLTQENCVEVMKRMEDRAAELRRHEADLEREMYARRHQNAEEERKHQELLKTRIRKALLEELAPEIKKFRTVGGTLEELMELWKKSDVQPVKEEEESKETDFEYEENGAAAGDLKTNDKANPSYHTVEKSSPPDDAHNDALVQQLYDARKDIEPHYRSTRSLDSQNEYLIISTRMHY